RNEGLALLRTKLEAISRVSTLAELARMLGQLRASGYVALVNLQFAWDAREATNPIFASIFLQGPHLPRAMYAAKNRLVAEHGVQWQWLAQLSGAIAPQEVDGAVRIDAWLAAPGKVDAAAAAPLVPTMIHRGDLAAARFPWGAYLDGLGAPPDLLLRARGPA